MQIQHQDFKLTVCNLFVFDRRFLLLEVSIRRPSISENVQERIFGLYFISLFQFALAIINYWIILFQFNQPNRTI